MNRSRRMVVWLLAFSLGLNAIFIGMWIAYYAKPDAATTTTPPPPAQKKKWVWNTTELFPLDDPEIKLTPEQRQRVLEVRRRIATDELRLNDQTVRNYRHWVKTLTTDKLTSAELDACIAEMCLGTKSRMVRLVHSIEGHRAVLTPEQQKTFDARMRKQLREMKDGSLKLLDASKTRVTAQFGAPFVASIIGPTSGTTERKP